MPDWEGVRLHVVSGKGGTGKTTVAAALAMALAADGKRTLLIEVEERQGIAELFGISALPYEERRVASVGPGALGRSGARTGSAKGGREGGREGEVFALAIDIEQALLEYLEMFYKLGRAGKALRKVGFIDFATTIAPGLRDVLLTGKACEAVRRKGPDGKRHYDAVVMDAPPTGRVSRFLNINTEVAGLARFGPIFTQSQAVMRVIRSPETAVHLVTLLEEMPVQETVDGVAELRAAGLPVGGVFVNMVRPPMLDEAAILAADGDHREELGMALADAGVGARPGGGARKTVPAATKKLVEPLLAQGREHAARVLLEREQRADVQALKLPTYELPLLSGGVDLGGLYRLAAALKEEGAA
ncbi:MULTISPECIES: ArsA-related P-loop ATPase [Streptacidiphilus]|uniref:ArsA-related P-loop ATPase n=1 Tax=Streptacidiphilus cavernicola TaxID=3342716 RepID=A0ABV6UT44_9ACTN|nr:ArsA-related P-loop ATPase [Streptacidiphilus jeojiense]